MIDVYVCINGEPLAQIEIQNISSSDDLEYSDYTVRYAVDRGSALGTHSRLIHGFPRKRYNAFALIAVALNTLSQKELELERDFDPDSPEAAIPSALARRLSGTVRQIQAGFSRLHRN